METTFIAQLWKRTECHEGEVTLTLKVPVVDAEKAKQIPVMTELNVGIVTE